MIDPRNYIPGCASYTKASEISSLQKYLKKGIKKRDEALELQDNPEELKKDPRVPGIAELPKGTVDLHDPREVTELPDKSLRIVNPREETLETRRESIKGAETPDLPDAAIELTDNREAALESRREDISITEVDSLVSYREDITDEHEVTELSETRLDINEALIPELPKDSMKAPGEIVEPESLENTRVGLDGDQKQPESLETTKLETPGSETISEITELPETVIGGPEFHEIPLDNTRLDVESNEDPGSLEDHRENISDKRSVFLEDHKESIEDHRKTTLEDHREELEDKRGVALEDHREDLEDKRNPKLETHKDALEDNRNVNLENHRDLLEDKRDPSLETHREGLEDKRSPKLETRKDVIDDKRNVDLDDTQLKAPGKQKTPELSGTVISGPEVKEVGLGKSKVTIEDKRGVILETRRENIEDKRNSRLSDHREDITDKRSTELPGTVIGLTDKRSVSLENNKESIEDSRNPELSEIREDIKVPGTPDLPSGTEELKVDTDVALENHQEKLTDSQNVSGLPGEFEEIPGEVQDVTLQEDATKVPSEIITPELNTTKITRPGIDDDVVLPVDTNKLEGTTDVEALENERLNLTDDREIVLPEDRLGIINDKEASLSDVVLPIEGEVPETTALEDTKLDRPGETPDINQIYSDTESKELYPLEGLDVSLPDTRLDITNPNEPFLEDEQLPMEPNASDPGWSGELENTVIHDNGDQNPIGWSGDLESERLDIESPETPELVTIDDIKSEPEDNWTIEPDKNEVGWDGALEDERLDIEEAGNPGLVTIGKIKSEPEDNWTIEADQNPVGWNEALEDERLDIEAPDTPDLVTVPKIKDEPEDNWTVEADQNPVGWDESLEDERLDITDVNEILDGLESIDSYASDTTLSQRGPSQSSDYVDIDQERRGNNAWPDDFSQDSAKAYGAKTETPEIMDPSQPNMATPNPWETGTDLNYIDTRSEGDLKEYGGLTEKAFKRPDHKDPNQTEDPNWKHIDTPTMGQGEFKEYKEGSTRDDLPEESNTATYVSREDGSQLSQYGAKTAVADPMAPDKVAGDLEKAFNWSSENMGRAGWHLDDLAIPAYKLGGSFTSFLNPSKYLRFIVEKTVGVIPLKGSLKQWILDEALAGLITARDLLEESLNLQPYRLPGSNEYAIQLLRQSMSGVDLKDAQNLVGNAAANLLSKEAVIIKNPINRPGKEDKGSNGKPYSWEGMERFEAKDGQNGSDIVKKSDDAKNKATNKAKKIAEKITKALGSNQGLAYYTPSYFTDTGADKLEGFKKNLGMFGTLSHLSDKTVPDITSFAKLKDALEKSPYVTTDKKLYGYRDGDVHRHDNLMTLDSNHVWEIILEPYLGVENGEVSYLPSIQQINYENFYGFGINTNWDTWIPFTSFELNSKKMVQKNLGLYSGEISIPQNLEFTNELRLVICDDQYKSWKRYFNYVMCASSYNCKVHDLQYYKKKKLKFFGTETSSFFASDLAYYHEGVIRPAPYKNLAFRCKIISMNPQYQAINVSDLLVVLKEFTEEWQGEVDASPTELAVTFSVVGENPKGEKTQERIMAAVQNWVKKITNPDIKTSPGSIFSF